VSTQLTVVVPPRTLTPRGAVWVGQFIDTFKAYRAAARATSLAKETARDAAAVRRYADSLRLTNPGMAADLYAAVDRQLG
jgi:hypothetical protein